MAREPVESRSTAAARMTMLFGMPRVLCSVLLLLLIAGGCARSNDRKEPAASPEVARLLDLAASPEVGLDPADAPASRGRFTTKDVRRLATWLVDAIERTATAEEAMSEREAVDHTFAALDMRSRVGIANGLRSTSRKYKGMSLGWVVANQWETGHRPQRPGRVIKAAWDTAVRQDHLGVTLQVVQAYDGAKGQPMFVERTFALWSEDPGRAPATQVWFDFSAGITAIDRCHVVKTGLFRPDTDTRRLQDDAAALGKKVDAKGIRESSDGDFRRGCD